jgi:inhibitor of cysteine peptidase
MGRITSPIADRFGRAMKRDRLLTLLLCIGVLVVFAHGRLVGQPTVGSAITDPTQPIQVIIGQDFTLTLESNHTTGYRWQLAKPLDDAVVKYVGSQYREAHSGRPGAGGEELWTFQAVGRGRTQIAMHYIRPWERNVPSAKQTAFVIVVAD